MNTIIKQATAITTAALLTIGLAACGNGNTANNTANTANTTQNETNKASKPKEKLNPGNWNAWDIKVGPGEQETSGEAIYSTNKISITNLSDETVYMPYFEVKYVTPTGDKTINNGKGEDKKHGGDPLYYNYLHNGISRYDNKGITESEAEAQLATETNWKPGETKTFTAKFQLMAPNGKLTTKNLVFDTINIVHNENELDDLDESNYDFWDNKYCPGENTDGTEEKTEDQCTEKWGPVFDITTGKKITDYATGKNMSTVYFEHLKPTDTSDWQADMDNYQRAQYKMKLEDLKKKQD